MVNHIIQITNTDSNNFGCCLSFQIDYQLYVVEQSNTGPFNRAMLMNVGAAEALRHRKSTQCFIFHDVDLLPEDDRNLYTCPSQPRYYTRLRFIFK